MRTCACGCGQPCSMYDWRGRFKSFVNGHNSGEMPVQVALLECLVGGPMRRSSMIAATDIEERSVAKALLKLRRKGLIRSVRYGVWELVEGLNR